MVYSFLTHRRETKLKAQTDPFSVNGERRRGKKRRKRESAGIQGVRIGRWWELSRRRCNTAYGADIEKGSPVASGMMGLGPRGLRFEGYSGVRGVETTLDRSCSGQRVAISLRMSRNRATFASSSVKTPPIALKGSSFLKAEPCFPYSVLRLNLR